MLLDSILPQHQRAYEEDTAASIIRREGFPPTVTQHLHVPHAYGCPCCSGLSPRRRTVRDGPSAEELDHRKRMQWDIYEDRALSTKPPSSSAGPHHRNVLRRFYATLQRPMQYTTKGLFNPPPPQTLSELRHGKRGLDAASMASSIPVFPGQASLMRSDLWDAQVAPAPFLLLTIHQGRGFPSNDKANHLGYQVQARYGTVEGMTKRARRCDVSSIASGVDCDASYESTSGLVQWDESFELPLQDLDTPIELFVIDTDAAMATKSAQCGAYLVGGVMIAPPQPMGNDAETWLQFRGDHEVLVATMFDHHSPKNKGGTTAGGESLVSLCVSWEVVTQHAKEEPQHAWHTDPTPELFAPVPIALDHNQQSNHPDASQGDATTDVTIVFDIDKVELYRRMDCGPAALLIPPLYCMLRGPDGECSDYVALRPHDPALKPLRFDDADDTGRTCTISCPVPPTAAQDVLDNARVLQVLVCCNELASQPVDDGAPLRVLASTALTFTALPSKGTATYVLECIDDEDGVQGVSSATSPQRRGVQQPFGEISVHWTVDRQEEASEEGDAATVHRPLFDDSVVAPSGHGCDDGLDPRALDADVLSVVVVRGIDLRRPVYGNKATQRSSEKLVHPLVSVAVGPLLASTPTATVRQHLPERGAPCNVVWNQELIFPIPEDASWDRDHVEVILQEDYEIVSLGSIHLQDKLSAVNGKGVVEGFDVVPLVQQGYQGALGHILVRWKYVYHDIEASMARRKQLQRGEEFGGGALEGEEDALSEAATPRQAQLNAAAQRSERTQTPPLSQSPGESPRSARLGPSPRKSVTVPSPKEPSATSTDHSPYGKKDSIYIPNSAASLPLASASPEAAGSAEDLLATSGGPDEDDDDDGVVFAVEDEDDLPPIAEQIQVQPAASPQRRAPSPGDEQGAVADAAIVDALTASTTDAPVAPRPAVPKLAFCIRPDASGKPCVSFFDPDAVKPEEDGGCATPHTELSDTCTPPPVNGPSEWSSQLLSADNAPEAAVEREKDARALLREELEVRYRGSRHPNRFLASPRGHWQQSQPWYPPGEGKDESHVPLPRRESERKQLDAIVELMLKSRAVAEQSNARQHRVQSDVSRSTSVSTAAAARHQNL